MLAQKGTNPHCGVRVGLFKNVCTLIIEHVGQEEGWESLQWRALMEDVGAGITPNITFN